MFSSQTTLAQYDAAVPASKVILGTPFFGIDWPTNNGTMGATATGGAADIPDSQAQGNGPEYWDPVTDTAWTSYQVGGQWHESYYEGENGLYDVSQLATHDGARGVGIWALGMERQRGGADRGARRDLAGWTPRAPGRKSTSSSAPTVAAPTPAPAAPTPRAPAAAAPAPTASTPARHGSRLWHRGAAGRTVPRRRVDDHHRGALHHRSVQRRPGEPDADRLEPGGRRPCRRARSPTSSPTCRRTRVSTVPTLNVYINVNGKDVAEAVTPTNCIAQDFQLP